VESLKESLDLTVFWEYRNLLLSGLAYNAYVWACALFVVHVFGFSVCMMRVSRYRLLRGVGTIYAELFRNTPEYILLTWVHFVAPLLLSLLLQSKLNFSPFFSAVTALGLAYSGYMVETYRSGIQAVPKGHIEAARALGMSGLDITMRIVLPQAVRYVLPEILNQMVSLFKATTLVSLIAVPDLLYNVVIVTQEEMRPLPLYTGAAIVYCVIIFIASTVARMVTDRWRSRGWA